jgi:acyl-CoA thioester hydrolase
MTMQTLPWDVPRPFLLEIAVGVEHLDGFGHVNNVNYLRWLEDVGWAHSNALGLDWDAYRRLNAGCVVHRHELDYLAACHAGDTLLAGTWIHENGGRLDMRRRYQIIRTRDAKTVMRAETRFVCVDFITGRPKRQPPEFVAAYVPGRGALD